MPLTHLWQRQFGQSQPSSKGRLRAIQQW